MQYKLLKKKCRIAGAAVILGLMTLAGCEENLPVTSPDASPAAPETPSPVVTPTDEITQTPNNTPLLTVTPDAAKTPEPTTDAASDISPTLSATPEPTEPLEATPTPVPTPTPLPAPKITAGEVSFSEKDHFFSEAIEVALSIQDERDGYITYTMDGTEPKANSTRYTEPLLLAANSGSFPNAYSIRAKAWYDDGTASPTYVHTYFVSTDVKNRYTTVVFSINGDPATLTDAPYGILYGENYKQRGETSERAVHIEAIAPDDTLLFSQFAGVRVFGGTSRRHAVKSLKLYARKEYEAEKGSFSANLFGSMKADGSGPVKKYDKLVLRNGGDDFQLAFLRDEFLQRMAPLAGFSDYEAVIPAVGYINGSYYGFYWLHESYCNKYFQNKYGKKDGSYIVLEGSERKKASGDSKEEAAAAKEFNELYKKYSAADLTNDKTYAELCTLLDVENYLDYMSYNMYVANYDWPHGNYRVYRYYAKESDGYGNAPADGRWRFLLHDMDIGLGTYQSSSDAGASRNDIEAVIGDSSGQRYAPLLARLLKRTDCRDYFICRMVEYMTDSLSYESVDANLTAMCAERDTELAYYFEHLSVLAKTNKDIYAGTKSLERHLARIRTFAKVRPDYMKKYLEGYFKISLDDYLPERAEERTEEDTEE